MHPPLIASIILNSNRREDTLECLNSLSLNKYPNHKIFVLDNDSKDGSVAAFRETFPQVAIIALTENLGYAGNNNVGIQAALELNPDWVFVLNEDIIFDSNCLAKLIEVGESDPQIGIIGPLVYHHDEPNIIQSAGGLLGDNWESIHIGKNEIDQGQFQKPKEVEWISGCAILVRRSVIEQVGMLDADYFIYWEETEWCIRTRKAGWKIFNVPEAKIWHKGVQRDYQPKAYVTYYSTRNHLYTLAKHNAPIGAWVSNWIQIIRTLLSWSIKPKWRDKREHRDAMWKGVIDFLKGHSGPLA
jgi:GT2 family glycosyltransferase